MVVFSREGRLSYYSEKIDAKARTITVASYRPRFKAVLRYIETPPNRLRLSGTFGGQHVVATLHRVDASKFLLLSRGFHWINEYPFNR